MGTGDGEGIGTDTGEAWKVTVTDLRLFTLIIAEFVEFESTPFQLANE